MNWQNLRDMGIEPDDGMDAPPLTDADYDYMRLIQEQTRRIAGMTTDAIEQELAALTPDAGVGWDGVHDLLIYELRRRGAVQDRDILY